MASAPQPPLANVRVVLFDAVGTLIHPYPDAVATYQAHARRQGVELDANLLRGRFRAALAREDEVDARAGLATSEERERQRWRSIVGQVLLEVANQAAAFESLWEHFAQPAAWRMHEDVADCLRRLAAMGVRWSVATNWDARLRRVAPGLTFPTPPDHLFISSEIGWRKPAAAFFNAVAAGMGADPDRILMVGDDEHNDVEGARQAGMHALLLCRGEPNPPPGTITTLARLPELLQGGASR